MTKTSRTVRILAVGLAIGLGAEGALAQAFPTKPVRVIVPFTAGSGTDVVARILSEKLAELWGKPVVVENRPGAAGTLGAGAVAKAAADGHTLLVHSQSYVVNPLVHSNLAYSSKDLIDVSPIVSSPNVLVVGPSASVRTVTELVAAAKAKPGRFNFGSAGTGSVSHLIGEKFRLAAGIDVVHVPYKGGPEATTDVMTGRITYWFPPIGLALPLVREGRLLALGVGGAQRSRLLPEVPTIAEAGVSGFEDGYWWGLWAPAGTPARVIDKIAQDVARALDAADVHDRLMRFGGEPMKMTPAEFARFVQKEIEDAARVVRAAGIKLE